MEQLGDVGQMEACFGSLEIVLVSAQDRCMDWDKHTIGLENHFGQTMELLGDVGQMEACCGLF
jgi:hypothetical protein